jgi:hypothetical protein
MGWLQNSDRYDELSGASLTASEKIWNGEHRQTAGSRAFQAYYRKNT